MFIIRKMFPLFYHDINNYTKYKKRKTAYLFFSVIDVSWLTECVTDWILMQIGDINCLKKQQEVHFTPQTSENLDPFFISLIWGCCAEEHQSISSNLRVNECVLLETLKWREYETSKQTTNEVQEDSLY